MNQGITVDSSLIKFLDENLPTYDYENSALRCKKLLDQNHFVLDQNREIYKSYFIEIENISDPERRKYFADIIKEFLENRKIELVDFLNKGETKNSFENLCSNSKDKILFDNNFDELDENTLRLKELSLQSKYGKIEIHNSKTFLEPSAWQKLKHLPTIITLKENEKYDLRLIFEPFVRNTKEIIIEDPYIRNKDALNNLKYLFPIFKNCNVTIKTYGEKHHKNLKPEDKKLFDIFVASKKEKLSLDYYKKAMHKERHIMTDTVAIYLPGGLDRFREGKPKMTKEDFGRFKIRIENIS